MELYQNDKLLSEFTDEKIVKAWAQRGLTLVKGKPVLLIDFLESDVITKTHPETKQPQEILPGARSLKLIGKNEKGETIRCANSVSPNANNPQLLTYHPSLHTVTRRMVIKDTKLAYFLAFLSPNVEGNFVDPSYKSRSLVRIVNENAIAAQRVKDRAAISKLEAKIFIDEEASQKDKDILILLAKGLDIKGSTETSTVLLSDQVSRALQPLTATKATKYLNMLKTDSSELQIRGKIVDLEEANILRFAKTSTEWTVSFCKDGVPTEQVVKGISISDDPRSTLVQLMLKDSKLRNKIVDRAALVYKLSTVPEVVVEEGEIENSYSRETLEAMELGDLRDVYCKISGSDSVPNAFKNNKDGKLVDVIMNKLNEGS